MSFKFQATTSNQKPNFIAWLMLIMLSIVWGSSFILIKKGLITFSYGQVGALRIIFAFLAILPFSLKNLNKVPKGKWKFIIFSGFIGTFIPSFLFAIAQTSLSSSVTGVTNALTPLFTLLIGVIIFHSKTNSSQIIGFSVAFLGTIVLSFINSSGQFGQLNFYILFLVVATFCYATNVNVIKSCLVDFNPVVLTSLAMLTIGPTSIIYLFTTDFTYRLTTNTEVWSSLAYLAILGFIGTSAALVVFNQLIRITSPLFATTCTYIVPIVAILWGLVDGEQLFALHYLGFIMILVGVYISNK